jgi:hypothetical protein
MRMFRGWFQQSKGRPCLRSILPKNVVLFCYFCRQKCSMQRTFIKKCFLLAVGSIFHVRRFTNPFAKRHLGGKRFPDEEVEKEVRKWLRQQSADFYAAGVGALVKRWDKCIPMSLEDMSRNKCFFQVRILHVLRFISVCALVFSSARITDNTHR